MGNSLSDRDRDSLIRTIIGEAGGEGPEGQAAVAHVILNRLSKGGFGNNVTQVVTAPSQFEPWNTPDGLRRMDVAPDAPAYQGAAGVVDSVLSGAVPDPTGGATHFFAPRAQAALGRQPPAWAKDPTAQIGGHVFFAPNGPADATDAIRRVAPSVSVADALGYTGANATAPTARKADTMPSKADDSNDVMKLYFGVDSKPSTNSEPASKSAPADDVMKLYFGKAPSGDPVTTPEGVKDSSTGELVVGGKPFTTQGESPLATARTAVSGFLNGLPVVGPYVQAGTERGAAAIRSLSGNTKFGDELSDIQGRNQLEAAAHPIANTAGGVAGAITGTLPLMAAAPAAFGMGGAALPIRMAAGGGTNALLGGADSAVRSGGDLTATGMGALAGGIAGVAAPAAGDLAVAGMNAFNRARAGATPAVNNLTKVLGDINMTPAELQNKLMQLGPTATIADADPALLTEAGALAARGGNTTSVVKKAMQARASGADDQASQLMEKHLGPKPDFEAVKTGIETDAATRAGPSYDKGRNGAAMDVTPILSDIDSRLPNATGGVEGVLNKVRGFLTNRVASASNPTGLDVPKSDPGAILGARQALDDMIEKMPLDTSAGKNAYRTATSLRGDLDKVIKSNPDFAAGDTIYAKSMGIRDALNEGLDVFKKNVRPEDLQRSIQSMTPEQLAAHRQGARVAIADAMEQSRRGELAGAQSMFARGSANRAKLDALFPNAQDALDALHSEATMRNTEQQLLRQSVTAERTAAMQKYAPQGGSGGTLNNLLAAGQGLAMGDPTGGVATAVANNGVSRLMGSISEASRNKLAQGTAAGLVANGPEQQAFLSALQRAQTMRQLGPGASNAVNLLLQQAAQNRNRLTSGPRG